GAAQVAGNVLRHRLRGGDGVLLGDDRTRVLVPFSVVDRRLGRDVHDPVPWVDRPNAGESSALEPAGDLDVVVRERVLGRVKVECVAHAPVVRRRVYADGEQEPRDERPDYGHARDVVQGDGDVAELEQQPLRKPRRIAAIELRDGQIRLVVVGV